MKKLNKRLVTASYLFSALCGGLFSYQALAQTCYTTLTTTTPTANFTIVSNGMTLDTITGLMWTRCSYGQTWDATNSTCTGSPSSITWQDALQLSTTVTYGGHSNWRLPTVKELATIVEQSCVDPSINQTIFPATSAENYWTGTTVNDENTWAWGMAFYNGRNNNKEKLLDLHVRFVRYAE
ncbi:MAG: hypothetical protein ACI8WB_003933 [Phenylobacterium sp.]|jgi:hypothetical protein